nr:MAG: hypothetical protein DIU70_03990 [Bacillota bacterium]
MNKNEVLLGSLRLKSDPETLERFAEALERGSLYRAYEVLKEAGTTSDFPILMGNAANRVLLDAYRSVPDDWRKIVRPGDMRDFREKELIRVSEAEDLEEVREYEEVKDSTLSESREKTKLAVYARKFKISWQTVVNDDLGFIRDQPARFGRAAARLINRLVFQGILQANPTMADGLPLFHASRGNLGSEPLSETALQNAITALRRMKDDSGAEIQVFTKPPKLVVPPELEWTARKLVGSTLVPQTSIGGQILADINTLRGVAEVVVTPFLTDPNDWYLVADPTDLPCIERLFAAGPAVHPRRVDRRFPRVGQ